jgi:hypothetical protein
MSFLQHIIRAIKSRITRKAGDVARMRERTGAYCVLVGESECKRAYGRPRHRWEKNTKVHFQEVLWGVGMTWIDMAQGRGRWRALVNAIMNLWVPYSVEDFLTS